MKRRVVLVGATPPPHHGMTIFMENILQSRLKEQYTLLHLDTSDHRDLDNLGLLDFWNVYHALKNILQMVFLCIRYRPAVVCVPNAQNTMGFLRDGLLILTASWFSNAAIVMHYHGGESFLDFERHSGKVMRSYIRYVLKHVDIAIVLGERLKYLFAERVKTVKVLHNGIPLIPPPVRNLQLDIVNVSYLSGLFRAKGVVDVINAAVLVCTQNSRVHFNFAGEWWAQEPETKHEVMAIIAKHRLDGRVKFHGKLLGDEKWQFLSRADIFVFPSWSDAFGLVNLEAMAAGCPVISSAGVGAIPEVVVHGETGLLVTPRRPDLLAEAILKLAADGDLRQRMGALGRKRYEEYFTLEYVVDRLAGILDQGIQMKYC